MPELAPSDIDRRSKLAEVVTQRRRAFRSKVEELEEAKAAHKLAKTELEMSVANLADLIDDQQSGRLRLLTLNIES